MNASLFDEPTAQRRFGLLVGWVVIFSLLADIEATAYGSTGPALAVQIARQTAMITAALQPDDMDGDGVPDEEDRCPLADDTVDTDRDGVPDCLDGCVSDPDKEAPGQCGCGEDDTDSDGDGFADCIDGCPEVPGERDDEDADNDGIGNACDNCPNVYNPGQSDADRDGIGDFCDGCPTDPLKSEPGLSGCGRTEEEGPVNGGRPTDLCPDDPYKVTPGACGCGVPDNDSDGDGAADCFDNCPETANDDQLDTDLDGVGDACDESPVGEAIPNDNDNFSTTTARAPCGLGMVSLLPFALLAAGGLRCRGGRQGRHRRT